MQLFPRYVFSGRPFASSFFLRLATTDPFGGGEVTAADLDVLEFDPSACPSPTRIPQLQALQLHRLDLNLAALDSVSTAQSP